MLGPVHQDGIKKHFTPSVEQPSLTQRSASVVQSAHQKKTEKKETLVDIISVDLKSSEETYTKNRRLSEYMTLKKSIQKLLDSPLYNHYARAFHDEATARAAKYFHCRVGNYDVREEGTTKIDRKKLEKLTYSPDRPVHDGFFKQ